MAKDRGPFEETGLKDNHQTSKNSNFITVFDNRYNNVYCAYEAQVETFVSSV